MDVLLDGALQIAAVGMTLGDKPGKRKENDPSASEGEGQRDDDEEQAQHEQQDEEQAQHEQQDKEQAQHKEQQTLQQQEQQPQQQDQRTISAIIGDEPIKRIMFSPSSEFTKILLSKLHTPITTDEDLMSNLSYFYKQHGLDQQNKPNQVYFTPANTALYRQLFSLGDALNKNRLKGMNGCSTMAVVGARGIGKSTALRHFVTFCTAAFPHCIAVYINFEDYDSIANNGSLLEMLAKRLQEFDINVATTSDEELRGQAVFEALAKCDKRVLLVCDSMDKMYEHDTIQGTKCLEDLRAIADSKHGCIGALVCAASTWSEALFQVSDSVPRTRFPLVTRPRRLESSKFPTLQLVKPLPVDLKTVHAILSDLPLGKSRLTLFMVGSRLDLVLRTLHESKLGLQSRQNTRMHLGEPLLPEWEEHLLQELYLAWWQRNRKMLQSVFVGNMSDDALDLNKIEVLAWETRFKPLTAVEVSKIWLATTCKQVHIPHNVELFSVVRNLVDMGYFVYDAKRSFYPPSMFAVCQTRFTKPLDVGFEEKVCKRIKGEIIPDNVPVESSSSMWRRSCWCCE